MESAGKESWWSTQDTNGWPVNRPRLSACMQTHIPHSDLTTSQKRNAHFDTVTCTYSVVRYWFCIARGAKTGCGSIIYHCITSNVRQLFKSARGAEGFANSWLLLQKPLLFVSIICIMPSALNSEHFLILTQGSIWIKCKTSVAHIILSQITEFINFMTLQVQYSIFLISIYRACFLDFSKAYLSSSFCILFALSLITHCVSK